VVAEVHPEIAVRADDVGHHEVHRRRADESRHEQVPGTLVEHLGRVHLLQETVSQHGDPITHRHRLGLVVRDVDGRHAQVTLQARDLRTHLDAELRVEVRERLVHEEGLRLADDGTPHRDALALTP